MFIHVVNISLLLKLAVCNLFMYHMFSQMFHTKEKTTNGNVGD